MLSRLRLQVTFPFPLWWLTLEIALQKVAKALLIAVKQGRRPIVLPAYFVIDSEGWASMERWRGVRWPVKAPNSRCCLCYNGNVYFDREHPSAQAFSRTTVFFFQQEP